MRRGAAAAFRASRALACARAEPRPPAPGAPTPKLENGLPVLLGRLLVIRPSAGAASVGQGHVERSTPTHCAERRRASSGISRRRLKYPQQRTAGGSAFHVHRQSKSAASSSRLPRKAGRTPGCSCTAPPRLNEMATGIAGRSGLQQLRSPGAYTPLDPRSLASPAPAAYGALTGSFLLNRIRNRSSRAGGNRCRRTRSACTSLRKRAGRSSSSSTRASRAPPRTPTSSAALRSRDRRSSLWGVLPSSSPMVEEAGGARRSAFPHKAWARPARREICSRKLRHPQAPLPKFYVALLEKLGWAGRLSASERETILNVARGMFRNPEGPAGPGREDVNKEAADRIR